MVRLHVFISFVVICPISRDSRSRRAPDTHANLKTFLHYSCIYSAFNPFIHPLTFVSRKAPFLKAHGLKSWMLSHVGQVNVEASILNDKVTFHRLQTAFQLATTIAFTNVLKGSDTTISALAPIG